MIKGEELPSGFKMTELGLLPEEWEIVRLADISEIKYGKARPKTNGQVPVFGSGGIYTHIQEKLVNVPTIMVGRKGTAGEVWFSKEPCWPSDTTFFLVIKRSLNIYYLFQYLKLNKLSGENAKTTLPSLQKHDIENLCIPLPPLPNQRAIAHILSTIQHTIEAQDKVISAARELKKSLMRHLFTYGPVPVNEVDSVILKETELGAIPEHWEVLSLGDIAEQIIGGGTPSTSNPDYWDGEIHWTTSKRIYGVYLDRGEKTISSKGLKESATHLIPKNNLIIGTRVGVGKVTIPKIDIAISQDLTGVFIDCKKYMPEFLAYEILTDDIQKIFQDRARGTTIKGIPRDDLKNIILKIPSYPQQQEIAHVLLMIDKKIEVEENRKASLQTLFKTMLHLLMTGQLRVKDMEV